MYFSKSFNLLFSNISQISLPVFLRLIDGTEKTNRALNFTFTQSDLDARRWERNEVQCLFLSLMNHLCAGGIRTQEGES